MGGWLGALGARARWRRDADVVVMGSGAAGIAAALTAAAAGLRVLVVTKDLVGGATPLAQGGLAAALGAGDTPAAHVRDTLVAGAGLCEPGAAAALADGAPGAIEWLTGLGARLETLDLRLEGGHSARRIVHSGDDASGAEVHRTLLAALLASGIEILDRTVALDLLLSDTRERGAAGRIAPSDEGRTAAEVTEPASSASRASGPGGNATVLVTGTRETDGAGTGARARAGNGTAAANAGPAGALAGEPVPARSVAGLAAALIGADGRLTPGVISARAVVIAAGGLGQAFATTSNPPGATGDGIAIAARAGAVIRDLEFVQFHPTVLWLPEASGQCPLITEALRGAGAVLRDLDGTALMAGHDPRGDLAPRDVVAARMAEVIAADGAGHVWLDATGLGRDLLEDGFPTVTAACRKHGIDPVTEMIPVAPGAHYSCGGILAGLDGRTSLGGLYAAGEAASTGVQGANRLASNSVTEAIIAGRRTGAGIAAALSVTRPDSFSQPGALSLPLGPDLAGFPGSTGFPGSIVRTALLAAARNANEPIGSGEGGSADARRATIAGAMSRYAEVMRDGDGLTQLLRVIAETGHSPGSRTRTASTDALDYGGGAESGSHRMRADGHTAVALATMTGSRAQTATMETVEGTSGPGCLDLEAVEAANLLVVSMLIAVGARRRAESRGCHRRRDAADTAATPWHTLIRWDGHRLVVSKEAL